MASPANLHSTAARPSRIPPDTFLRWLIIAALSASVLWAAIATRHWRVVIDAPMLHYVVFLIDHGKVPYRDIIEMDLPGTYALQWAAIHWLGPGAAGWRIFDFSLIAAAIAAMVAITWPIDWLAGFFAGCLFALIHFRDGPPHTGQRDLMMAVMALIAVAFLLHAFRRNRLWAAAAFGFFAGFAAIIKPSGQLFYTVPFILLWLHLRRERRPALPLLATSFAGFAIPLLACIIYLVHLDALRAFLDIMRGIGTYHASLGRPSLPVLIIGSFPSVLLAVALPALPLFLAEKPWKHGQAQVILACTLVGALSYIIQGKGFPYHRYPTEAFLLVLCSTLLVTTLRATGWRRSTAIIGLLAGALFLAPASASIAVHFQWDNQEFQQLLTADLNALGGPALNNPALNNKVQCFEMAAECENTLRSLNLVMATGFMYDCYMFQPTQTPVSLQYRAHFWQAIHANPPTVYIVTDQGCFNQDRSFSKVDNWPQFRHYLETEYTLTAQRTPPHLLGWWRHPARPFSYQLYVRKQPSGSGQQP